MAEPIVLEWAEFLRVNDLKPEDIRKDVTDGWIWPPPREPVEPLPTMDPLTADEGEG